MTNNIPIKLFIIFKKLNKSKWETVLIHIYIIFLIKMFVTLTNMYVFDVNI